MKALIITLLAATGLVAIWPRNPSAIQLRRAIGQRGAAKVAEELSHQQNADRGDAIADHVATGSVIWLDIAKQLRPYTDAGATEGLENALAEALLRNPV